jgi:hypothetical protein
MFYSMFRLLTRFHLTVSHIYGSTALVNLGPFFSFLILYRVGRTG